MKILNYIQYNSIVTLSYFFLCLVIQILNSLTNGKLTSNYLTCYRRRPTDPRFYTGVITHAVSHFDWDHLINNMTLLLLIGPAVEERYGSINLLIMFVINAIVVGYINMIITTKSSIAGASSNTSMLIVLASFASAEQGKIPLTVILIFLIYLFREIKRIIKKDGAYHTGHILGYFVGLIFGFYFMK